MNNIYVDGEFVNRCNDCPFYDIETEVEFVGYEKTYHKCLAGGDVITGNCPLKPLSDRLKEERKKVVQEIKNYVCNKYTHIDEEIVNGNHTFFYSIHCRSFLKKLDQIERGER